MGYDLWPRPVRLRSFAGKVMRLSDDVRTTVGFIGHVGTNGAFSAIGTGFLLVYKRHRYFVTNKHIAVAIGEDPFAIRFTDAAANSLNIHVDPLEHDAPWMCSEDEDVDLAIISFNVDLEGQGCRMLSLPENMILTDQQIEWNSIGAGDLCYAVGLFRLMAGRDRNIPFVHTGHIGVMATEERVPILDWDRPGATREIEAHLVQMQNLRGLSGAPVFVRPALTGNVNIIGEEDATLVSHRRKIFLLGVWQGSWEAPPSHASIVEQGGAVRVPVGVGVVVPARRLIETLELPEAIRRRRDFEENLKLRMAAKGDAHEP